MLVALLFPLLALAAFRDLLLAHLAAVIAIGLVLAGRRPVDHLAARLDRRGSDIVRGLGEATAGQQRQRRSGEDRQDTHNTHSGSACVPSNDARASTPISGKSVKNPSIPIASAASISRSRWPWPRGLMPLR